MPTDMLEDAILVAKKALDEFDFEADGVKVRNQCERIFDGLQRNVIILTRFRFVDC